MLRRNSKLAFAGGMWVFPGGRVDPEDRLGSDQHEVTVARRAPAREAREESALEVEPDSMLTFSHWTPPPISPKRFSTWFFAAATDAEAVTIDDGEIKAHAWMRPADALHRRDAGEIELAPPTWVTLHELSAWSDVRTALRAIGAHAGTVHHADRAWGRTHHGALAWGCGLRGRRRRSSGSPPPPVYGPVSLALRARLSALPHALRFSSLQ